MSGNKVLWGQVLIVGLVVLTAVWTATEWTAWRLAFQPELGKPFGRLLALPLYSPPIFFWWWFEFNAYAPKIFRRGRLHRRRRQPDVRCGGDRHVGVAGAGSAGGYHLRLRPLG